MNSTHVQTAPAPATAAKFWSRVDRSDEGKCWKWTGAHDDKGYGVVRIDETLTRAHRVAFSIANGPIPPGLVICHRCDNPECCNPAHLFLGTNKENGLDSRRKGRSRAVDLPEGFEPIVTSSTRPIRGPSPTDHPWTSALRARGVSMAEWARRHKVGLSTVRSWAQGGAGGRAIPRSIAEIIEKEDGVPISAWKNGIVEK